MCGCYPFTAAPKTLWRLFNSPVHSTDGTSAGSVPVVQAAAFKRRMGARSWWRVDRFDGRGTPSNSGHGTRLVK
jgi:hypothetical protein